MSDPTLKEICENEKVQVSPETLDQECTDKGLKILAKYCGSWENVARELFLQDTVQNVIDVIETKKPEDRKSELVLRWKGEFGIKATYEIFFKALLELERSNDVKNAIIRLKEQRLLEQHPKEQHPKEQHPKELAAAAGDDDQAQSSEEEDDRDWKDVVKEIDDTRTLKIDDISDVMDEVGDLAGQWEMLARKLGIKPGNIGRFRAYRMGNVEMALNDAVADWLKKNYDVRKFGKPNWRTLANAVQLIDDDLARTIARNHPKGSRIEADSGEAIGSRIGTDAGEPLKAVDHEKTIYTKEEEKKLVLNHKPDQPADEKKLKLFCKEINVIIHVVNEYEFGAATTYITAPNRSDGNGIRFLGHVLGMFAGQKVALVQTRPGADCYEGVQNAMNELSLDVQYIFGVGVCYSLKRGNHHFGDILVANRISSFETFKLSGSDILPRGERTDISQDLRKIFCQQTIYWNDTFKVSRDRSSKAYCGLFISTPILLSSSEEVKKFKDAEPEAIGGEMEGFKLMKMKRSNGLPMEIIVIKGVVDYGNESKGKVWEFTTAMAAFNFVKEMIKKKGADFSKSTEKEKQLQAVLIQALLHGYSDVVEMAMNKGASVAVPNEMGQTAVHIAGKEGQLDVLKYFHKMIPDVEKLFLDVDKDSWNILHYVCAEGHKELLVWLLESIPKLKTWEYLNQKSVSGYTPLLVACENLQEKMLKYLLEDVGVELVDITASTSSTDENGNKTGLHLVAAYDMKEMAELLIEKRCPIDATDAMGNTALHIAVAKSSTLVATTLRAAKGGDKLDSIKNKAGQVPGVIEPEEDFIIPNEIEKRGPDAVAIYKRALKNGKCKIPYYTLLILGQERTGKTSLYRQMAGEKFDPELKSTRGIDNNILEEVVDERQLNIEEKERQEEWQEKNASYSSFLQILGNLLKKELFIDEAIEKVPREELKKKISEIASKSKQPLNLSHSNDSLEAHSTPTPASPITSSTQISSESTNAGPAQHPRSGSPTRGLRRKQQSKLDLSLRKLNTQDPSLVLNALDFAGQNMYRPMHHCFISREALYLVVFDIEEMVKYHVDKEKMMKVRSTEMVEYREKNENSPDPFEELRYWLHSIHAHIGLSGESKDSKVKVKETQEKIFLVGTHKKDYNEDKLDKINKLFRNDKDPRYKDHIHRQGKYHFFPVENSIDKKSGSDYLEKSGIEDLRNQLKETLKELPFLKEDRPLQYLYLESCIEFFPPIVDLSKLRDEAKRCGLKDKKEQDEAFNFLHVSGKILWLVPENLPRLFLYDHECDELKNLVILRRQWLFNVMTVILGFKSKTSNKEGEDGKQSTADVAKKLKPSEKDALEEGRADSNVLQKCWKNFTDNADISFEQLCLIFRAYCLIYLIKKNPDDDKVEYLIPCMLPELTEERKEELKDQLENRPWFYMYFDFEKFLPAQIYYQLVCLLLGDSKTSSPEDIFTSTVCVLNDVKDYHWKVEYERDSHGLKVGVLSSCEDKLEHIKDIHNNLSSICTDSSLEGLKYYGGPFEVKCPVENCSQCILPYVCYGREEIKDVVTCIKCKQTTDVRSKLGGVTSNKDFIKLKKESNNNGAVFILTDASDAVTDYEEFEKSFNELKFDVYCKHGASKEVWNQCIKDVKDLKRENLKKYRCLIFIFSYTGKGDKRDVLMMKGEEVCKDKDIIKPLFPEAPNILGHIPRVFLFETHECMITGEPRDPSQERKPPVLHVPSVMKVPKGGNYLIFHVINRSRKIRLLSKVNDLLKDPSLLYSFEALLVQASIALKSDSKDLETSLMETEMISLLNCHINLEVSSDGGDVLPGENAQPEGNAQPYDAQLDTSKMNDPIKVAASFQLLKDDEFKRATRELGKKDDILKLIEEKVKNGTFTVFFKTLESDHPTLAKAVKENYRGMDDKPDNVVKSTKKIGAVIILTNRAPGAHVDGKRFKKAFMDLNFDVYWTHGASKRDLERYIENMKKLKKKSFETYRCLIFIFSCHGKRDQDGDILCMREDNVKVYKDKDVIRPLFPEEVEDGLIFTDIPKVFLFESCRRCEDYNGEQEYIIVPMESKVGLKQTAPVVPTVAKGGNILTQMAPVVPKMVTVAKGGNYLDFHATNEGYFAYGNENGGYLCQEIVKLMDLDSKFLYSFELLLMQASINLFKRNENEVVQPVRISLLDQHINLHPDTDGNVEDILKEIKHSS